ncbi:MAG: carotenoid oxygenase family protein [Acidimicrobiales bacterium]
MTTFEEAIARHARHPTTITGEPDPYLGGPYERVVEEWSVDGLEVVGEIPADLDGVYLRNGPNPQFDPPGRYHWFDGDGMIHAVRFRDGTASYANRWVRTAGFEREREASAALWSGVIEPLGANPATAPLKDTANTDLVFHNGKVLALWYLAGTPYAIDPCTLDDLGPQDFGGTLPRRMSAHAKADERTGELFYFDYGPTPPYLSYGVVGPDGRVRHHVPIDLPGPRLPHDMAVTENHAILMDLPLVNDPDAARHGRWRIVFRREWPARFGVLPQYGDPGEVRWFDADPCYVYHSVNAWEEGDEIVLDLCRVTKPEPRDGTTGTVERMLSYLRLDAHLYRYRFNLRTGATTEGYLDDDTTEFPTIDTRRLGHPSRVAYTMHVSSDTTLLFDGIVKYDTARGAADRYTFGPGRWGSEAPFAPRPGSSGEDDGYLVSFVHDETVGRSEVVVLDAGDLGAAPAATVRLPMRVPLGFHAVWVPGERLAE